MFLLAASTSEERGKRGLTDRPVVPGIHMVAVDTEAVFNACLVTLNVIVTLAGGPRNWLACTAAPVCTEALSVLSPH